MKRNQLRGFSTLEVALVLTIILLLFGLLFPVLAQARRASRMATCTAHLRQVGIALAAYREDHGSYPNPKEFLDSVEDRRLLVCPEDGSGRQTRASSYIFRARVATSEGEPQLWWQQSEVDPNVVLLSCKHHQELHEENDVARTQKVRYPFRLVLRADGRVEKLPLSQIRYQFIQDRKPHFFPVYPGEPGYARAEAP